MLLFSGQSRSRACVQRLIAADIGECTLRGELPPRRTLWFYDNGAYRDHLAGNPFGSVRYTRDIWAIRKWSKAPGIPDYGGVLLPLPHFILLPDRVGGGAESLRYTMEWAPGGVHEPPGGYPEGVPLYIAVQDGMDIASVAAFICHTHLGGIFVGGTMQWKLQTAAQWVRVAHRLGRPCHIGRAMSLNRLAWAERIGADSVDGNAVNWSVEGLERVVRARGEDRGRQGDLFGW